MLRDNDEADWEFFLKYRPMVLHLLDAKKTGLDPEKCDCGEGDHCILWDDGRPNPVAKAARDQRLLLEEARARYRAERTIPP